MKVEIKKNTIVGDVSNPSSVTIEGDLEFVSAVLEEMGYSNTSDKEMSQCTSDSGNKSVPECSKCGIDLLRVMMYSCPESNCPCGLGA